MNKLTSKHLEDYEEMLESMSRMVLEFVREKNAPGVRRWASSLAHVGHVMLDNRKEDKSRESRGTAATP